MVDAIDPVKAERRRKRAERREKQRQANTGRAHKMHVARLAYEKQITFSETAAKPSDRMPSYHIGCSGWFYWDWRGKFYPEDAKTNEWFPHYTKHFKTVELNAPFYAWPTIANVKTWIKQLGKKPFVYTVKVSELITHIKRFKGTKQLIKDFGHIADLLGPRMGCFLFQLPPSYHYTPSRLKDIVSQLDPARKNVVEFRHASWWNTDVYKAFQQAGIIFCSCSGPRLPDELVKTTDSIYVRFHGPVKWYRHDYSKDELAVWAKRIRDSGAKEVWVYFNNDFDAYAIKNAKELLRQLKRKSTDSLKA